MENKEPLKNYNDLLDIGRITRDLTLSGHTIKLRTLSFDEQSALSDNIPPDVKDFKRLDLLQKELVAAAMESIDGDKLAREDKVSMLGNGVALCNFLYSEYEEMLKEQVKTVEDVKKNSSPVTKATV